MTKQKNIFNLEKKVKQFNREAEKSGLVRKINAYNLIKDCDTKLAKKLKTDINKGVEQLMAKLSFTPDQIWKEVKAPKAAPKNTTKGLKDVAQA